MGPRDLYQRLARTGPGDQEVSRRALLRLPRSPVADEDIDFEGATERVREGWDREGHEALLRALAPVSETLADLAEIGPGQLVLDVGAGDGNLALAALERGADVEACDLAAHMVERGQARFDAADRDVLWLRGDVQDLPYPDETFDRVVSSFGAALAPRPNRTTRELARVAVPGAIVALAAWVPRGLPGSLEELIEPIWPRPAGVPRVAGWGIEEVARRRLERMLEDVQLRMRTLPLRFSDADTAFEALVRPSGLSAEQRELLRPGFDNALAAVNNRPPAVEIDARYLVALGRVPD